MGQLKPDWRPDLTNTHPPFVLPPMPGWFGQGVDQKIVSFDPWGAMSQEIWHKVRHTTLSFFALAPTCSCGQGSRKCLSSIAQNEADT